MGNETYEVRAVLAGAYRGNGRRGAGPKGNTLTHAIRMGEGGSEADESLCGRIDSGNLCDVDVGGEPTCPVCARRLERMSKKDS